MKHFTCLWHGGFFLVEALESPSEHAVFDLDGYEELSALLEEVAGSPKLEGVVLLVAATSTLARGIDFSKLSPLSNEDFSHRLSTTAQRVTSQVRSLTVPVVCAVEGPVHGAALGIFLAAQFRICCEGQHTYVASTEIKVGILPFDGTTYLLARAIGTSRALEMVVSGRRVDAKTAVDWGLVDSAVDLSRLRNEALQCAWILSRDRSGSDTSRAPRRFKKIIEDNSVTRALLRTKIINHIESTFSPSFGAPFAVAELMLGVRFDDAECAYGEERAVFVKLVASREYRCLVHARKLGLRMSGFVPKEWLSAGSSEKKSKTTSLAFLGSGEFGSGLAAELATRGVDVSLFTESDEEREGTLHVLGSLVRKKVEAGRLDLCEAESSYSRFSHVSHLKSIALCDCFVDGSSTTAAEVAGRYALVRSCMRKDSPFTFLVASPFVNLDEAVSTVGDAHNILGIYGCHPIVRQRFVEICLPAGCADESLRQALKVAQALGKKTVVSRFESRPVAVRMQTAYLLEALYILAEGSSVDEIDYAMARFGMHKGPFAAMDDIGLDLVLALVRAAHEAHSECFPMPHWFESIVAGGKLGRKSGSGFYRFEGGKRSDVDVEIYDAFSEPPPGAPLRDKDIVERCVFSALNEGMRALRDGQVRHQSDLDFISIFSLGFPAFRGGISFYCEQSGWEQVLRRFAFLERHAGPRFAPVESIRRLAASRSSQ